MSKYPGRILRATAPTVTSNAAPGIWTVDEALQYKQAGTWPEQIIPDPYFNQTTLLLHGDGTNGAQNNTFVDSSSNALTISREGNATQGTFSPFSVAEGEWSNYFDGNSDYLTTPVNASLGLGSSDFCIEWWEYRESTKDYAGVLGGNTSYVALYDPIIWSESGNVVVYLSSAASSWDTLSAFNLGSINVSQWVHFCLTKNGSTFRGFKNGVLTSVTTTTNTVYMSANSWRIGYAQNRGGVDTFPGYISNLRMSIGSIPTDYQTSSTTPSTSIFTPSTSPLTTSSQGATSTDVELLICQSNRFKDNSSNDFTITPNGNVAVQPFSPFAPSAAYSPSVNGGSGYFDGNTDRLVSLTPSVLNVSSGDFTFECWVYHTATTQQTIMSLFTQTNSNYAGLTFGMTHMANGSIDSQGGSPAVGGSAAAFYLTSAAGSAPHNAWNHVALTRNGSTFTLWVNGASAATYTQSNNLYWNPPNLYIGGSNDSGGSRYTGYITGCRMVVGAAIYTAPFSVPTSPPTETSQGATASQVELLMTFDNAGIFDNTGKNNLETVGNAQIDTTTVKYGTGSMEFDGTGDYIRNAPQNVAMQSVNAFGTGDFTIECWIYLTTLNAANHWYSSRGGAENITTGFSWGSNSSGGLYIYTNGQSLNTASSVISTNTWFHVAFCRASGTAYMFVDGTQVSTGSFTNDLTRTSFGIGGNPSGDELCTGFIDDFRITKGVARYTATFTPPTKAFTDQ